MSLAAPTSPPDHAPHALDSRVSDSAARRPDTCFVGVDELVSRRDGFCVIDTRSTEACTRGVIPGSRHLPLAGLVFDDTSAHALEQLATSVRTALQQRGIRGDEHLVFVDDTDGSAALGVLVSELAGCTASVLRGGITQWHALGHPLDLLDDVASATAPWCGSHEVAAANAIASFEQTRDAAAAGITVIDTRSQLEHEGIVGNIGAAKGNIPESVHMEWSSLFDLTGDVQPADRIHRILHSIGVQREDQCILYCTAAHRAAAALLIMRHAGYAQPRIFLGGWHEWTRRDMPVYPRDAVEDGMVTSGN